MTWFAFVLVAVLGFANQRGSTCAVSAADEIVTRGSFHRVAGFALAALISAALLAQTGSQPHMAALAGWSAAAGGAVAALGASLNGRCAMGTIASLGRGRLDRLGTLAGFLLGAAVMLQGLGDHAGPVAMQRAGQSTSWAATAVIFAALAWLAARRPHLPAPGWMALIGLINAVLLWWMVSWSYTASLTAEAGGRMVDARQAWLFLGCLMAGSVLGAVLAGTWRPQRSTGAEWLRSLLGGTFLGAGSALVPGGNDAMLLVGLPLLVPGLCLAYAVFWTVLLVLRYARYKTGGRGSLQRGNAA